MFGKGVCEPHPRLVLSSLCSFMHSLCNPLLKSYYVAQSLLDIDLMKNTSPVLRTLKSIGRQRQVKMQIQCSVLNGLIRSRLGAGLTSHGAGEKSIREGFLEVITFEGTTERHGVNSHVKDNREKRENGTSRGEYS